MLMKTLPLRQDADGNYTRSKYQTDFGHYRT